MITAKLQDNPSLKAVITHNDNVIFGKIEARDATIKASIAPRDQILHAQIIQKVELESYYETSNEAGGNTIIIGD